MYPFGNVPCKQTHISVPIVPIVGTNIVTGINPADGRHQRMCTIKLFAQRSSVTEWPRRPVALQQ